MPGRAPKGYYILKIDSYSVCVVIASDEATGIVEPRGLSPFGAIAPAPAPPKEYPALAKSTLDKSTIWHPRLPGHGLPGDGCGSPVPYHCNHHDESFWTKSHCLNRDCPDCYELWASREAKRASMRIAWGFKAVRQAFYERGKLEKRQFRAPKLNAFVMSFRLHGKPLSGRVISGLRRECYAIASELRIIGGCCVPHPFRQDRYDHWISDDTVHFHLVGMTLNGWTAQREVRNRDLRARLESGEVVFKALADDEYSEGPRRGAGGRSYFERPDWRGFRSGRAVKRHIQYLLTHSGIVDGQHALTWFGAFAYNRLTRSRGALSTSVSIGSYFPHSQDDISPSPECPVCGSRDTERCTANEPVFQWGDWEHERPVGTREVANWPEPSHGPDEMCENEAIWHYVKSILRSGKSSLDKGTISLERLLEQPKGWDIRRVIRWNLGTGRLILGSDGDTVRLARLPTLDSALSSVRKIVLSGEPIDGTDSRLESLIGDSECGAPVSDEDFVFGPLLTRYRAQVCLMGCDCD